MALTKDFKQTVVARVQKDAPFRRALLTEAIEIFERERLIKADSLKRRMKKIESINDSLSG